MSSGLPGDMLRHCLLDTGAPVELAVVSRFALLCRNEFDFSLPFGSKGSGGQPACAGAGLLAPAFLFRTFSSLPLTARSTA